MEYKKIIERIIELLEKTKYAVLATSNKNGVVSASKVGIINDGLKVYVQTDNRFEKIQNIKENENIAINIDSIYFKGKAKINGSANNNKMFVKKMKEKNIYAYENYTNLPNEVLVEIELTECRIWGFEIIDGKREEIIKVIDLKNQTINKIICDILKEGY